MPNFSFSAPLVGEFTRLYFSLYLACSVLIRVGLDLSNCNFNDRIDPNVLFFDKYFFLIKIWRKLLLVNFGENLEKIWVNLGQFPHFQTPPGNVYRARSKRNSRRL